VWGFFAIYMVVFGVLMLMLMMTGVDQVHGVLRHRDDAQQLRPGSGQASPSTSSPFGAAASGYAASRCCSDDSRSSPCSSLFTSCVLAALIPWIELESLEALLARGPDGALLRFSLGTEYLKLGRQRRARAHLERAWRSIRLLGARGSCLGKACVAARRHAAANGRLRGGIEAAERKGDNAGGEGDARLPRAPRGVPAREIRRDCRRVSCAARGVQPMPAARVSQMSARSRAGRTTTAEPCMIGLLQRVSEASVAWPVRAARGDRQRTAGARRGRAR
jgi:hypothetical protein